MWNFSAHILKRLKEREILKSEILSIVNNEVDILVVPSDKDKNIDLYFGKINSKYLMVVLNRKTKNLITTRKMRKNEKTAFNKESSNG
jgi:hypothetical protein